MIEFPSKLKTYMLLSRKTTTQEDLEKINKAIDDIRENDEYNNLVSWYIYPILLMHTTESKWFQFVVLLGMISFSLSGVILGYKNGSTLLGTVILCVVPSFGGGVLRDVALGRYPIWFMRADMFVIQAVAIGVIGFLLVKIFHLIWKSAEAQHKRQNSPLHKILDNLLIFTDSIGVAAFTVSGVFVCLQVKAEPLVLWGPFFAFLTGSGGALVRDLLLKFKRTEVIYGPISAENSIIWGFVLSYYLTVSVDSIGPKTMEQAVIFVVTAGCTSRLIFNYFKISNLYISKTLDTEEGAS